jgi:O-antigen/teichoic acid export membrane protein
MVAGQGANVVFQAICFILLARLLGSTQYGVYAGAVALVSVVSQYSGGGFGILFIRHVSTNYQNFALYWGNILIASLGFGALLVFAVSYAAPHLISAQSAAIILPIAVADCLCGKVALSAGQVFQAFEKLRFTAVLNMTTNLLRLIAVTIFLRTLHQATAAQWAIAALTVTFSGTVIAVITVTRSFGRPTFDFGAFARKALEGLGFSFAGSTTALYNDLDKTMLSHAGMNMANGVYTMAYRIVDIGTIPIYSIAAAALPTFFRTAHGCISDSSTFARQILKRESVIAAFVAGVMFAIAPIVPHLVGPAFAQSVSAIRWLALMPLLRSVHLSAGDALTGSGHQRLRTTAQCVAAGLNFGLNLCPIPAYSWLGAAWSSLLTDGTLGALNWMILVFLHRRAQSATVLLLPTQAT